MKAYGGSGSGDHDSTSSGGGVAPGKRARTEAIQRRRAERADEAATTPGAAGSSGALPAPVQAKMEDAFDFDFSSVRVHQGGEAQNLGALAYTQGTDVHFAPGQYDPGSARGQELIGHELAHVVQQSEGRVNATTQMKGVGLNDDSALEREADDWGAAAARGESVGRGGASASAATTSSDAPVQRFKDYSAAGEKDGKNNTHWAGNDLRVADDGTAAIAQPSIAGSQEMYVLASRLPSINADLKNANAPLKLIKSGGSVSGGPPGNLDAGAKVLDRVKPVEPADISVDKRIPDDCGNAARTVSGAFAEGKGLRAEYNDKAGKHANVSSYDPELMKYEIMVNHFGDRMPRVKTILADVRKAIDTSSALGKQLEPYVGQINTTVEAVNNASEAADKIREEYDAAKAAHDLKVKTLSDSDAADKADQIKAAVAAWETARTKLNERFAAAKKTFDAANAEWNKLRDTDVSGKKLGDVLDEFWKADRLRRDLIKEIMGPYEAMKEADQEAFDEKVGINRHADPSVGEAYTISSGGPAKSSRSTWNFHWGGVIFKSTTGSDNITMENYAGGRDDRWYLQMYGVPTADNDRAGQTFHEQHRDVHAQHGTTPTTMSTEKK